jgi:hypothetical protein
MTRDDIIRFGIETDLFIYNGDDTSLTIWLIPTEEKFLKFAALVAAAEREACAKLCEDYTDRYAGCEDEGHGYEIAAAIRARGE